MVQNFLVDARGVLRPRTEKDGRPKGAVRIVSPYDPDARRAIRGNTRWNGYLLHVTETCDTDDRVNLITDMPPPPSGTPRPCPASTPGSATANCCPRSTWLTAATFPPLC
jgi:hypothetical protein